MLAVHLHDILIVFPVASKPSVPGTQSLRRNQSTPFLSLPTTFPPTSIARSFGALLGAQPPNAFLHFDCTWMPLVRPRHQTEIVSWAHPGPAARIPAPCPSLDASPPQKKRLSTRTMHFKWHHRNLSNESECDSAVYSSLHGTQGCHLVFFDFLIPKMPKNIKTFSGNPDGTWSVQLFLPGPWRFCWGPAPVGPTLVTGPRVWWP